MKKTIVQIDGGHLRALAQRQDRVYNPDFIDAFGRSLADLDEEIIPILYYDCAPYAGQQARPMTGTVQVFDKSAGWLTELATKDLMAVRLGTLKWRGWKPRRVLARDEVVTDNDFKPDFEQKGVDLKIGLDIATYAIGRFVDRIILVTGDTDLIPAMKLARRNGVQIVGISVPGSHLSSELRAHFDIFRTKDWPRVNDGQ